MAKMWLQVPGGLRRQTGRRIAKWYYRLWAIAKLGKHHLVSPGQTEAQTVSALNFPSQGKGLPGLR
jgi:hypothetical protein